LAAAGEAISGPASDGTVISGFHRTIRYTANQEEDLIDAAAGALPSGTAKNVMAKAYVLKDLTTGAVVAGRNTDQLNPIASLTKLVTAVIARRLIPDASRITITKSIMATYGNTADFTAGETFTASDLLYPLLIVSSNDAAEAYAQFYGRSAFIRAMNDFTQSIGAYRTSFADPSGLDPENVSTPNDMVIILDWIRKNDPTILDITAIHAKTIRSHTWINPTHFLSWSYYIGGKNGYLPEADRTTASLFTLGPNKDIYAAVVLGSDNRDADVIKLLEKVPK
jgi:D-alanyl-D-alanine carboxypeptidase